MKTCSRPLIDSRSAPGRTANYATRFCTGMSAITDDVDAIHEHVLHARRKLVGLLERAVLLDRGRIAKG